MIGTFNGEFRYLSNFEPVTVIYEDLEYPSVEHAYVAAKTTDISIRQQIQKLEYPGQAKRFGQRFELRSNWKQIKLKVMRDLLKQKFQKEPYKGLLLATKCVKIVEGNAHNDRFWGKTMNDNGCWIGENHLGELIMSIRLEMILNKSNIYNDKN